MTRKHGSYHVLLALPLRLLLFVLAALLSYFFTVLIKVSLGDELDGIQSEVVSLAIVGLLLLPGVFAFLHLSSTRRMVVYCAALAAPFPLIFLAIRLGPGGSQDGLGLLLVPFIAIALGYAMTTMEQNQPS